MIRAISIFFLLSISIALKAQLPTIYLKGEFGYDYQEGEITIVESGNPTQYKAKIKWRGGTTNTSDKHKRNYKIKLTEDASLLGLRSDNNWILDAGQADVFRLRNRIATEIWNDMAHKPYYYDQEPNALTGVRGKVVEVYLNDEYRGIYCLTEAMDRKELKLKKFDKKTGQIHGGLWKSESWGNSLMYDVIPYDNCKETWGSFEVKYPDLDDLETTDYSTLSNAIAFVATSSDEDFSNHIHEYFDMPVIIDYYIFLHALNAYDNTGKNIFWAVYDKEVDKKITPAVWDLDGTVGQKWIVNATSPELEVENNLNLYVRLKKLNVDAFKDKARERYYELREGVLSTESLVNRYEYYYNLIKDCGAAEREENKWSGDSDVDGRTIHFESEFNDIKNWIIRHMDFLDKTVFSVNTDIQNIDHSPSFNHSMSIYNLQGKRLYSTKRGINIVDGKKVMIK
ncbi:MAG: CotH kinase family protein [Prevotella sp.]|nr:CotH kinase family protein [Prevotella sp.]